MDKQLLAVMLCLMTGSGEAGLRRRNSHQGGLNPFRSPSKTIRPPYYLQPRHSHRPGFIHPVDPPFHQKPANYAYKYDVDAPEYGTLNGHQEQRQGEVARGRYYVLLPDGRTQTVEYTADQDGYHPTISYHYQPFNQGNVIRGFTDY